MMEISPEMDSARPQVVTQESVSRKTKDGRILTYTLRVIQQPDHARACGSGQKAHADRRPVDPPPVVELTIRDQTGQDVTFSHDANFFLFATLEASPQAPGRGAPAAPSVPVLTGVNVSGMAYLDRPTPAGYFLFPDLSVRHEGSYKLNFNLYEELKRPGDADMDTPPTPKTDGMTGPMAPKDHMHWRLDVKSTEFQVYSAKKFPGLENSTSLSRTIAEQGCRIRIRRDVRMRRREHKSKKDTETQDESRRSSTAGAQTTANIMPVQAVPIQAAPAPVAMEKMEVESHEPQHPTYTSDAYARLNNPYPPHEQARNPIEPPPADPYVTGYNPALQHAKSEFPYPSAPRPEQHEMEVDYHHLPPARNLSQSHILPPVSSLRESWARREEAAPMRTREILPVKPRLASFDRTERLYDLPSLQLKPIESPISVDTSMYSAGPASVHHYSPATSESMTAPSSVGRGQKRSFDNTFSDQELFESPLVFKRASGTRTEKRTCL